MANRKGHMISLVTRMLIVVTIVVSIYLVVAVMLILSHKMTWTIFLAMIILATLAIATNYRYWRPRCRVL
jgi:ABC-type multidrug transport system fused ATPase/permease subunit